MGKMTSGKKQNISIIILSFLTILVLGGIVFVFIIPSDSIFSFSKPQTFNASATESDSVIVVIKDDTITVCGNGKMKNFNSAKSVPWHDSRYDISKIIITENVESIGDFAFADFTRVESLSFNDKVTSIGSNAFADIGIAELSLPNSLAVVQKNAFSNCEKLKIVSVPIATKYEQYAFISCTNIQTVRITGNGNGNIENTREYNDGAPWNASSDIEVIISDEISIIPENLFYSSLIKAVTLPSTIKTIEDYAFYHCTNLTSINLPSGLQKIGKNAFNGCGSIEEVVLPASLQLIDEMAFANNTNLFSVISPENSLLHTIGTGAFSNDTKLLFFDVRAAISIIEPLAFSGCTSLAQITFSTDCKLNSIGHSVFKSCSALKEIILPKSAQWGAEILNNCTSLTKVTFNDSMTSIPKSMCSGCTALTSVMIPNSITKIEARAFENCESLTIITLPDSLASIGGFAFANSGLTVFNAPESLEKLEQGVFSGCRKLIKVSLGNKIAIIPALIFQNCDKLAEITVPDSVLKIEALAFQNCENLSNIYFGKNITNITYDMFENSKNILQMTFDNVRENVTIDEKLLRYSYYLSGINIHFTNGPLYELAPIEESTTTNIFDSEEAFD